MARITVIGAGYVGLVSAGAFASLGHRVQVLEISHERLQQLRRGDLPFYEPGIEELVLEHVADRRLVFSDDYASVIPQSEFCFLAVDTPPRADGSANMSSINAAISSILEYSKAGLIIVLKSTVPPGTGDAVAAMAREARREIEVVSNPEFLSQGSALRDFLQPERIVIGTPSEAAFRHVADLYEGLNAPIIRCDRRSAELAKYAANAMLATRISFINEIASICDAIGANVEDVATIVGLDSRIGSLYLKAGLGWGGSCLPKDVSALTAIAASHGVPSQILEAVASVNQAQRRAIVRKLAGHLGSLEGRRIVLFGLAFKPNTDDIRGAPAIDIISELLAAGASVAAHDPFAMPATARIHAGVDYCADPLLAARDADAIVVASEWREYLDMDWALVRDAMRGRLIVDGRNVLDQDNLISLGFTYSSFGRNAVLPAAVERDSILEDSRG